jgi:hypothetical protein
MKAVALVVIGLMLTGIASDGFAGSAPGLSIWTPLVPTERERVVALGGPIERGELRIFLEVVNSAQPDIIILDSPGGNLGEALDIAKEIQERGLNTFIYGKGHCASACALLFLAGSTKYARPGAMIGLHSGSLFDGTPDQQATMLMALFFIRIGAPAHIVDRIFDTPPSEMYWLTEADKEALGIETLPSLF